MHVDFDPKDLAAFLVTAKTNAYAAGATEAESGERAGFNEIDYKKGAFEYRDSYAGLYSLSGQEVVWLKGKPVWAMAYNGSMMDEYQEKEFAESTFRFLKSALLEVREERPYRGPTSFYGGDYSYINLSKGDISGFKGEEAVLFKGKTVFKLYYIGGLIVTGE
jgi:hypothetical protein